MPMTFDEACVACADLTNMSAAEWADFLSCSPAEQVAIAETYRDMAWRQSSDTFSRVLAILSVAAQVAGAVAGITGAINALRAL